jgi:excisionase family DNA binding protein
MSSLSKIVEDIEELTSRAVARVQRASEIPPRLLDIDDAARYLSMSDKSIRELIVEGQLPYVQKIPGRSPYRLDVRDLDKWVEKSKIRTGE